MKEPALSSSKGWAGVVLAGGVGRRMRSQTPKAWHPLAGRPLVRHVVEAAQGAGMARLVLVVPPPTGGPDGQGLYSGEVDRVEQASPLGPADALAQARRAASAPHLLVLKGDTPLLQAETIARLVGRHTAGGSPVTLLVGPDSAEDALAYCFEAAWLWPRLEACRDRADGEATLVEALGLRSGDEGVALVPLDDPTEALDVDDRVGLAAAEAALRARICHRLMLAGVTILDPATTYIDADVAVAADSTVAPNTHLRGRTTIGPGCYIGPNSVLVDAAIGARCQVLASVVEGAVLEEEVEVGPFSHLRPGTYLCAGVHIGNYAEVKNSRLGRGTRTGHFSYIGDAQVGDNVNIGAGTVTCNFDGVNKNETIIEDGAFIGSDTMLVAPVRVGRGGRTGAGAVVTRDVPPGRLAVGVPARIREEGPPSGGS